MRPSPSRQSLVSGLTAGNQSRFTTALLATVRPRHTRKLCRLATWMATLGSASSDCGSGDDRRHDARLPPKKTRPTQPAAPCLRQSGPLVCAGRQGEEKGGGSPARVAACRHCWARRHNPQRRAFAVAARKLSCIGVHHPRSTWITQSSVPGRGGEQGSQTLSRGTAA